MKFEIEKTANGEWYFRIVAKNGKTLCHSESYKRKRNARETANLLNTTPLSDTNGTPGRFVCRV
ncbi:YegP family protein [Tundrisphaera lichenicola]|uniref:YegP family protein n=1 Tax=Tundrisphaera lichenicola TaxID=2029860 RepID=UPI003EB92CA2